MDIVDPLWSVKDNLKTTNRNESLLNYVYQERLIFFQNTSFGIQPTYSSKSFIAIPRTLPPTFFYLSTKDALNVL